MAGMSARLGQHVVAGLPVDAADDLVRLLDDGAWSSPTGTTVALKTVMSAKGKRRLAPRMTGQDRSAAAALMSM